ncbi:hypothetical protein EV361DRAFT_873115 [Lentinula raphanica]|nr:hypothetical protein EV361DRAFT_873115 [Lentinula raphanica]
MDAHTAPLTLHTEPETGMLHDHHDTFLEKSPEIPKTSPANFRGENIPTAPPSPLPVYKPGELRRHDTLFFLPEYPEMGVPSMVPPILHPEHEPEVPKTPSSDFFGDSIPTAPPSPLPVYKPGELRRHDTLFFLPVHPEMNDPTVPPTPHPEHESEMPRCHDAFFLEESPEIPTKILPPNFLRPHQDNAPQHESNKDVFKGDSVPTAPPSPLPANKPGELGQHSSLFFLPASPGLDSPTVLSAPHPERHDTFFPEKSPDLPESESVASLELKQNMRPGHANEIVEATRETLDSYSEGLKDTLEDCYLEVLLQNTHPDDIPEGMSLEQYVEQTLNRRRFSDFLALAYKN